MNTLVLLETDPCITFSSDIRIVTISRIYFPKDATLKVKETRKENTGSVNLDHPRVKGPRDHDSKFTTLSVPFRIVPSLKQLA